jgi:hypothetical protein
VGYDGGQYKARSRVDKGSEAFHGVLQETGALLANGIPIGQVIEIHPNIAALWDEDEFNRSGPLSKWVVGMVHSAKLRGEPVAPESCYLSRSFKTSQLTAAGDEFTCYASMYVYWYLLRWMIAPSPKLMVQYLDG